MNAKNFCVVPWAHARINPDGDLLPCCKISDTFPRSNINNTEFVDWWNGKAMQDLRQDFLDGNQPRACQTCWNEEAVGKTSLRQEYNQRLGKYSNIRNIIKNQVLDSVLPIGLDLNLGNICNFRCIMCSPAFSSRIQTEMQQHQLVFKSLNFLKQHIDFDFSWPDKTHFQTMFGQSMPNIKLLELKGGEPLLIKDVAKTIRSVKDKHNSIISLTTNGSVAVDDDLLNELGKFGHIWFHISVDGVGDLGEYVRYGSKWTETQETVRRVSGLKNCSFKLVTVFQFFSSATFPDVADYAIVNGLDISLVPLINPDFLSINAMLPHHQHSLKSWLEQRANQHPNISWLQSALSLINSYRFDSLLHEQCQQYVNTLDRVRHNAHPVIQGLFK